MEQKEKKILSKFEWFLLFLALGILLLVILQNQGVHVVETIESVEITKAEERQVSSEEKAAFVEAYKAKKNREEHLESLTDYFSKNRAQAKAAGKDVGFSWSSLKIEADEKAYLKDKYGEPIGKEPSTDWLSAISNSYKTYKSVKSAFTELGIDTDKIINADNASRALSNPIIANSIYQKMERDFGIPAERSKSFAEKNRQSLDKWARFVEEEMKEGN